MRQLLRYRQALNKLDLVVLYEPGYVPVSKAGAELLFDVIATAYDRNSLIVTTNLPFENWAEVLSRERLTGAALDRLTHRCHILETRGESYRLQNDWSGNWRCYWGNLPGWFVYAQRPAERVAVPE
jgi:DNA replication protein DnaC